MPKIIMAIACIVRLSGYNILHISFYIVKYKKSKKKNNNTLKKNCFCKNACKF